MTGIEIVHERITQHQSPLMNIQLNGVAGILLCLEVGEGHEWSSLVYEHIIGHPDGVSGCCVTVPMLSFG